MRRPTLRLLLGIAAGVVILVYATLSAFARRPLRPGEAWTFGAAVARATPAHLGGSSALETLRLGGAAFGSPLPSATFAADGVTYILPLPPRTVRTGSTGDAQRFVTFATAGELRTYLHVTLPRAGWRYREQFGSMHALQRGDAALSVRSTFYVGTRVGELRISLRRLPHPIR